MVEVIEFKGDLEDPRYEFWVRQVDLTEPALISTKVRLNSQGCVEKFRRAV